MRQLTDHIQRHAQNIPDKTAIVCGEESITYHELWQAVRLRALNFDPDTNSVIVRASQSTDFLITYFAAHHAHTPIIPLEHDAPDSTLLRIERTAHDNDIPPQVADILYTTGTTGQQKGTMISHQAIIADAENLIEAQVFCPDPTFVISGPLNHIGSLSKVWPTIIVGGTIVITEGIKDINKFMQALSTAKGKVATFLVPASIRILLQFAKEPLQSLAGKIDFIETGASPIPQADMETLCQLLPDTRLYNTYASTETGIIATHNYNGGYCKAGCLGKPMKHSRLAISPDGHILCQGLTIMTGYLGDTELTQQVLRNDIIYTQDKGHIDTRGRLQLTGRTGDIINVGGYKIKPVEVEDAAKAHPTVADCICIAAPHPVLGTTLKLLVVTTDHAPLNKKILAAHLLERLERHKVPLLYEQTKERKRTYNGKLHRKHYITSNL